MTGSGTNECGKPQLGQVNRRATRTSFTSQNPGCTGKVYRGMRAVAKCDQQCLPLVSPLAEQRIQSEMNLGTIWVVLVGLAPSSSLSPH